MTVQSETISAAELVAEQVRRLEAETRLVFPSQTHVVVRVDGKNFGAYTRNLDKPFDLGFVEAINATACAMVKEITGASMAYVQSDEISVILSDLASAKTQPYLAGVHSKVVSITAALATANFNVAFAHAGKMPALFDSRAFPVSDREMVTAYLISRQTDARRNALGMVCDAVLGKSVTMNKGTVERKEMLREKGVEFDNFDKGLISGRVVVPQVTVEDVEFVNTRTGEREVAKQMSRKRWVVEDAPDFYLSATNLLDRCLPLEKGTTHAG